MTAQRQFRKLASPATVALLGLAAVLCGCLSRSNPQAPAVLEKAPTSSAVVEIDDPSAFTQVAAVSDPHGMFDNLHQLLLAAKLIDRDGHWTAGKTLLIVVGDSIDKGPKSLEILDLWMSLTPEAVRSGGRIICLLGNHEAEFLADPTNKKAEALREELDERHLDIGVLVNPSEPRARFLRAMPVAARIGGRWLFCHAGWLPAMPWPDFVKQANDILQRGDYANPLLIGDESILEKRDAAHGGKWWDDEDEVAELESRLSAAGLYGVVFGHQPEAFGLTGRIGVRSPEDDRLIKIDSGMAPDAGEHPGELLLFTHPDEMALQRRPDHLFAVSASGVRPVSGR